MSRVVGHRRYRAHSAPTWCRGLVRGGHEVIALSRGQRDPYHPRPGMGPGHPGRGGTGDAEDARGHLRRARFADLRPDVVVDLGLLQPRARRGSSWTPCARSRPLLLHCGTILGAWSGPAGCRSPRTSPAPAYGEYGTSKAEIEALAAPRDAGGRRSGRGPCTPGHISGPGWPVITPAGNLDPAVWTSPGHRPAARAWPDHGLGVACIMCTPTTLAQAFERALSRPAAIGASFHVVAEQAMTLAWPGGRLWRGWFRTRSRCWSFVRLGGVREPRRCRPRRGPPASHTLRSITASIARGPCGARLRRPRYTARWRPCTRALAWLVAHGQVDTGGQPFPGKIAGSRQVSTVSPR